MSFCAGAGASARAVLVRDRDGAFRAANDDERFVDNLGCVRENGSVFVCACVCLRVLACAGAVYRFSVRCCVSFWVVLNVIFFWELALCCLVYSVACVLPGWVACVGSIECVVRGPAPCCQHFRLPTFAMFVPFGYFRA